MIIPINPMRFPPLPLPKRDRPKLPKRHPITGGDPVKVKSELAPKSGTRNPGTQRPAVVGIVWEQDFCGRCYTGWELTNIFQRGSNHQPVYDFMGVDGL